MTPAVTNTVNIDGTIPVWRHQAEDYCLTASFFAQIHIVCLFPTGLIRLPTMMGIDETRVVSATFNLLRLDSTSGRCDSPVTLIVQVHAQGRELNINDAHKPGDKDYSGAWRTHSIHKTKASSSASVREAAEET